MRDSKTSRKPAPGVIRVARRIYRLCLRTGQSKREAEKAIRSLVVDPAQAAAIVRGARS